MRAGLGALKQVKVAVCSIKCNDLKCKTTEILDTF